MVDERRIISERISGKTIRDIAHDHNVTTKVVNRVLDDHAKSTITAQYRTQTLALELDRLDGLQQVFHDKAMDGDVASGALLVKIAERRATLLGLNSPVRMDAVVEVIQATEVNSTDKVRAAIDRIRGIAPPKPN